MSATAQRIDDARLCCTEGRFHAAATLLLEAFRLDPCDGAVALELGVVMRASGDLQAAIDFLSRAHFADPVNPQAVAELVLTYHDLGWHHEASRVLVRSLEVGLRSEDLAQYMQQAA
jgi:predicted Zn-dependent protease